MSYCKVGDTPKVQYKFADGNTTVYQSNVAPIDVSGGVIPPSGTTSNYNKTGYQISFPSPQAGSGTFTQTVLDYKTRTVTYGDFFNQQQGLGVTFMPCGSTTFSPTEVVCTGTITIDNAVHCPTSQVSDQCQITVSSNGVKVFQANGKCPISFTVACGNCPEGQCECHSDSYPGYCCSDCNAIASSITAITNDLRAKNGR